MHMQNSSNILHPAEQTRWNLTRRKISKNPPRNFPLCFPARFFALPPGFLSITRPVYHSPLYPPNVKGYPPCSSSSNLRYLLRIKTGKVKDTSPRRRRVELSIQQSLMILRSSCEFVSVVSIFLFAILPSSLQHPLSVPAGRLEGRAETLPAGFWVTRRPSHEILTRLSRECRGSQILRTISLCYNWQNSPTSQHGTILAILAN